MESATCDLMHLWACATAPAYRCVVFELGALCWVFRVRVSSSCTRTHEVGTADVGSCEG
jgi:hypothetical protein